MTRITFTRKEALLMGEFAAAIDARLLDPIFLPRGEDKTMKSTVLEYLGLVETPGGYLWQSR